MSAPPPRRHDVPAARRAGMRDPNRVYTLAELDAIDPVEADRVRAQAGLPPRHAHPPDPAPAPDPREPDPEPDSPAVPSAPPPAGSPAVPPVTFSSPPEPARARRRWWR